METKYKFIDEREIGYGIVLHRIQAVRDFGDVKCGDIGGWIQSEENLSHDGDCWVSDEAMVYNNAQVCDDAVVSQNAMVYDTALVCKSAKVYGKPYIYGNATISGNARVFDEAVIFGDAWVKGDAKCFHCSIVKEYAVIEGDAEIGDNSRVSAHAYISGKAIIGGNSIIDGYAEIIGDAKVMHDADYIVFKNWWGSLRHFTWTRSNNMWKVGCFHGTGNELINKAYLDSRDKGDEYKRVVRYVEEILKCKKS